MDKKEKVLLFLLLALAAWLRALDVSQPFDNGLRGSAGAGYTMMAQNHLRYGFCATGLVPVMNTRPVEKKNLVYYEHHPPGMVALTALFFKVSGHSGEGAARALPLVFSLLTLWALFIAVRALSGSPAAWTATVLAASVPLSTYYGVFLNFETFVIPPTVLSLHYYMKWRQYGRSSSLRASLAFMLLGGIMDWTAFIAGGLIAADGVIFPRPGNGGRWRRMIPLIYPALALACFAAVKSLYLIQNARFGAPSEEGGDFLHYLLMATFLNPAFDFKTFADQLFHYLLDLVTWPVLAAAVLGLLLVILRALVRRSLSPECRSVLILLLWGILNLALFASHATGHEYWILLLYPALCWAAGIFVREVLHRLKGRFPSTVWVPGLALILVLGMAAQGVTASLRVAKERRGSNELYRLGLAYKRLAENGELILTPQSEPAQVIYYSGGLIYLFAVPTPEVLAQHLPQLKRMGCLDVPRIFAVQRSKAARFRDSIEAFARGSKTEKTDTFIYIRL